MITILVFLAIFAPLVAPYSPTEQNLDAIAAGCCPGPSREHLLGVDDLGRDELSRLIYGARYSLLIGVVAVTIGLSMGLLLGAVAGYFRRADSPIMRVMDIMLAIPGFLMAIGIVALFGQGGLLQVMIAIGVVNIPIFTRSCAGRSSPSATTTTSSRPGRWGSRTGRSSARTSSRTRSRP